MDPSQFAIEMFEFVSQLSGPAVYATIVGILLICGFGVPIPEDITLFSAGFLAASHRITLPGAMIASFVGVMLGDSVLFFLGRRFGKKVFALPGLRRVFTPERILGAETRIRKHGPFICFIARFLPGLRTPIFAMTGALGVRPSTFFALDGLAALLSVPLWVYAGYWLGTHFDIDDALDKARTYQHYVFAFIATCILLYVGYKVIQRMRARRKASQLPQA